MATDATDPGDRDDGPHPPAPETECYPVVACPNCGAEQFDIDGQGVVYCPARALGCGYCAHPTRAAGVCLLCGDTAELGQGDA